jgi:hypothetical protein
MEDLYYANAWEEIMYRFLAFIVAFSLVAASANAADVAGKWYGISDSQPVITIYKAGPAYSASLEYPDTTKSVRLPNGMPDWSLSIHKDIVSFEVVGSEVRFTIRSLISRRGDTNYARDDYNLTMSEDGHQMTGTVRRTANSGSGLPGFPARITITPITLFPTDFATRSQS